MSARNPRKSFRRFRRASPDHAVVRPAHIEPVKVLSHGSDEEHDRYGRWRRMAFRRHYLGLAMDRLITGVVVGVLVAGIWALMGWTIWKAGWRMFIE